MADHRSILGGVCLRDPKATNIVWHQTSINRTDREVLLQQKGTVIWLTGLSGSGKSTIASALESKLYQLGKLTYLLDGDNIRHGLNTDLGFNEKDRTENIRRIGEVAKLFVDAGVIVLTAFISPFREDRDSVRRLIGDDFVEVWVDCSLEICMRRDPKGLYKKAKKGEIKDFTGLDSPYEDPENPEVIIKSHEQDIEVSVNQIINYLEF